MNKANVDPQAVASMAQKVQTLSEELDSVSKKLIKNIEILNQAGHRDVKFIELKNRVYESQDELKKLIRLMDAFKTHLKQLEKIILEYLNTKPL